MLFDICKGTKTINSTEHKSYKTYLQGIQRKLKDVW